MKALDLLKSLREDDKEFGATDEDLKVFDEAIKELMGLTEPMYKNLEEYESIVGYELSDAFKLGWSMARLKKG